MRKILPIVAALALLLTATAASALSMPIPPLPDFPESSWDTGSSLTYNCAVEHGADAATFKLRTAVLSREDISDTTLYWVEFGITDIAGIPAELQAFFLQNYGELPNAMRMKVLIPKYDLISMLINPSKFYYDFTAPGFIQGVVFQYNRNVPMNVDPALVRSFFFPLIVSGIMDEIGGTLPDDFVSNRNIGVSLIEDPQAYTTENSESETTVEAGSFTGWRYAFTSTDEAGDSGTLFHCNTLPILPVVSFLYNWTDKSTIGNFKIELSSRMTSGATTQIVGEPQWFDLQALMSYAG